MWHLLEDFLEQSLVMKAFIGWGWLSVLIMLASIVVTAPELFPAAEKTPQTEQAPASP